MNNFKPYFDNLLTKLLMNFGHYLGAPQPDVAAGRGQAAADTRRQPAIGRILLCANPNSTQTKALNPQSDPDPVRALS